MRWLGAGRGRTRLDALRELAREQRIHRPTSQERDKVWQQRIRAFDDVLEVRADFVLEVEPDYSTELYYVEGAVKLVSEGYAVLVAAPVLDVWWVKDVVMGALDQEALEAFNALAPGWSGTLTELVDTSGAL